MHTCPRRVQDGRLASGADQDQYRSDRGDRWVRCSYCGSLASEDFMAAVRDGVEVGPTDKSYKVYVDGYAGKFYFQHLDVSQQREFIEMVNAGAVNIGYPGRFHVLPFFATTAAPSA
jgi:hypothetical protein